MTDRNIYLQTKNVKEKMNGPGTLYELLIFDNEKLAAKTEGPHMILRRARPGDKIESPYLQETTTLEEESEAPVLEEPAHVIVEEQVAFVDTQLSQKEVESASSRDKPDAQKAANKFVSLETISTYIESLAHHVPAEVDRVVEAIISLESEDEREKTNKEGEESGRVLMNHDELEALSLEEKNDTLSAEEIDKDGKKKSIDLSEIFRSLKNARKKATQKSTSYTKKVEYED